MREVQLATVTIPVALLVQTNMTPEERKESICRKLRLSEYAEDLELRPGLYTDAVDLTSVETIAEAAERRMGQAEAAAEAKLDRQRERYFDRHGHF
ncbi:hypothetical protein [Halonotius roseus]|uniref:Uncharacterized protein n=1 Tax=Halonotius roseus TaxID=2511997 RepID=A0A544QR16_9EURY|nr:hypothetical protein [Halonotius roseus]TQQ81882.1 hypothetical protein EWF95_02790 [Halonotius roseus]